MHHAQYILRQTLCLMLWGTYGKFRFQDLEIWKDAIEIGNILFDIADKLEEKKLFRFAEQLRRAGMSTSNNIAEGLGSHSRAEFRNFLNIAKRSTFENANILIVLHKRNLVDKDICIICLIGLTYSVVKYLDFRNHWWNKQRLQDKIAEDRQQRAWLKI